MSDQIINFWEALATTSTGVVITLLGFWFTIGRKMATTAEVCELIDTRSPYLQDKQFIMERLNTNKEVQSAFANALQRNSDVLIELKVQIATLAKALETLETRIEKG
jgi:hypothetical protein